jgi:hypothetical protein
MYDSEMGCSFELLKKIIKSFSSFFYCEFHNQFLIFQWIWIIYIYIYAVIYI